MISYSHLLTFMQEYNGIHWRNIMEWEFKRQAESPVACANLRPYQFREGVADWLVYSVQICLDEGPTEYIGHSGCT